MTTLTSTTLTSLNAPLPRPVFAGPTPDTPLLRWPDRPVRVNWLIGLIVLFSAADLYLTLQYMMTTGMAEANPLVLWVVEATNSALPLIGYKLLLTTFPAGLFYMLRYHRSAEFGAWAGAGVLTALMAQWWIYASFMATLDPEVIAELQSLPGWVTIG